MSLHLFEPSLSPQQALHTIHPYFPPPPMSTQLSYLELSQASTIIGKHNLNIISSNCRSFSKHNNELLDISYCVHFVRQASTLQYQIVAQCALIVFGSKIQPGRAY